MGLFSTLFKRHLKISHYSHTGRLRPHEYTSYLPLMVMLIVVSLALAVATVSAALPPQADSVGITGTMPGPPPKTGATITSPKDGQHFTTVPITVSGTCEKGTLIEIYKTEIFAGSTVCKDNGTFTLEIDLLAGPNTLTARTYDALNQLGPESNKVLVYYDALPLQFGRITSADFGGAQLILITDAVYRGLKPGKEFNMPITVLGGRAPYAVNVQWGDGTNSVIARKDNQVFNAPHTYKKPGTFPISLQGSDDNKRVAFLTVAAIVDGQPGIAGTEKKESGGIPWWFYLWPLLLCAIVMVVSFWLGERREKKIMAKHGIQYTTQYAPEPTK